MSRLCYVRTMCPSCKTVTPVECDLDGFEAWQNGVLIQDALPQVSVDDREMLKTGICVSCWPSGDEPDDENYLLEGADDAHQAMLDEIELGVMR